MTRARLTQIMNLLNLAREIQERLLFLPGLEKGRDLIGEHHMRPVCEVVAGRGQQGRVHFKSPLDTIFLRISSERYG